MQRGPKIWRRKEIPNAKSRRPTLPLKNRFPSPFLPAAKPRGLRMVGVVVEGIWPRNMLHFFTIHTFLCRGILSFQLTVSFSLIIFFGVGSITPDKISLSSGIHRSWTRCLLKSFCFFLHSPSCQSRRSLNKARSCSKPKRPNRRRFPPQSTPTRADRKLRKSYRGRRRRQRFCGQCWRGKERRKRNSAANHSQRNKMASEKYNWKAMQSTHTWHFFVASGGEFRVVAQAQERGGGTFSFSFLFASIPVAENYPDQFVCPLDDWCSPTFLWSRKAKKKKNC